MSDVELVSAPIALAVNNKLLFAVPGFVTVEN